MTLEKLVHNPPPSENEEEGIQTIILDRSKFSGDWYVLARSPSETNASSTSVNRKISYRASRDGTSLVATTTEYVFRDRSGLMKLLCFASTSPSQYYKRERNSVRLIPEDPYLRKTMEYELDPDYIPKDWSKDRLKQFKTAGHHRYVNLDQNNFVFYTQGMFGQNTIECSVAALDVDSYQWAIITCKNYWTSLVGVCILTRTPAMDPDTQDVVESVLSYLELHKSRLDHTRHIDLSEYHVVE